MRPARLIATAVALTVIAAACGGTTSSTAEVGPQPTDPSAPSPAESTATALEAPTESDRPLDLSGGAARPAEPPAPNPDLSAMLPIVAEATAPWPTDWTLRTVELDEFLLGIQVVDPRDRIRPIDTPRFEPVSEATWLDPREPGALVRFEDEVRFYPLSILTRHEIVNDRFGDIPVVVSFCPLCNTAIAFDARVDGEALRFGVSGLLRNSDLVMWDESTTSLWQQITGEAVVGELAGTQLDLIPTSIVSYGDVLENFPDARSLSEDTGFGISYGANGYRDYSSSATPFLFDGEPDPRFPALSRVVGVSIGGTDKSFPFPLLSESRVANDVVGGEPIVVLWGGDTADALDASVIAEGEAIGTAIAFRRVVDGQELTFTPAADDQFVDDQTGSTWTVLGRAVAGPLEGSQLETVQHRNEFWFAWAAFFPDAPVYGDA